MACMAVLLRRGLGLCTAHPTLLPGMQHTLRATEAIGVRHMAMLGRFRRRMAGAALSALINGNVLSPSVLEPKTIASLASLMIKVGVLRFCHSHCLRTYSFGAQSCTISTFLATTLACGLLRSHSYTKPRQVLHEMPEFSADAAHLDSMDFVGELGSDYVLAARVALSK